MVRKRKLNYGVKIFLIGLFIIFITNGQDLSNKINDSINILADRYLAQDEPYLMTLEIPKIKLKQKIYPKDSPKNNVKYHVQLLAEATMPDLKPSHLIFAAHSGTSRISYFRNLAKLEINDEAYIYWANKLYVYVLESKEKIPKTQYVTLKQDKLNRILTLITCIGQEQRLIVNFRLIKEEVINY